MSSNEKNTSRDELRNEKRDDRLCRKDPAFPVWSRIHRVVSQRERFQGFDYSGLSRFSRSQIRIQSEENGMIKAILIAIGVIAATIYFITEDTPSYCSDYMLLGQTYDKCLTKKDR